MAAAAAAGRAAEEAAAAWERAACTFETANPGCTDSSRPRTRVSRWHALAQRGGDPARLRADAELLAADGRQAGEEARQRGRAWAGAWAAAVQAEQQACQAYLAWEAEAAEARRRQEAEARLLGEAEARRVEAEQAVLRRLEHLEAEVRCSREAAEVERAQAAKLVSNVARLESVVEGLLGPEVHRLHRGLPEIQLLLRAARARRPAVPGLPAAAAAFEGIVAALHARQGDAKSEGKSNGWQDAMVGVKASRASLVDAVQKVRLAAAALGAAAPPVGEEELAIAAAVRDQTRAEHLVSVSEAMARILACNNCNSVDELCSKVAEARAAAGRIEAALEAARVARAAAPELGARTDAEDAGFYLGELDAQAAEVKLQDARAAYERYVRRCDGSAAVAATEKAVKAFEKLGPWESSLACRAQPGEWLLSFTWEERRTPGKWAADPPDDRAPASLAQVVEALERVRQACAAESAHWDAMDPVRTFPLWDLLDGGEAEVELRKLELRALSDAAETHQALAAELDREQALAALLPTREAVERELAECRDEHADAEFQLVDAKNRENHVRRKRGVVEPELQEAVAAARRRLRQADARFQGAMSRLLGLSRDLPEVARWAAAAGAALPPELLRLWRGCRDLDYYAECERLEGGHAHEVYRVREAAGEGAWHVVKRYELRGGDLRACLTEAARLVRLRHPHVAEVTGLFSDLEKYVYMQMTYYSEGDLAQWFRSKSPDQASVRRACRQVLLALVHLHDFRVVHSDVKPENVFVDQFGNAFLGDFDVSVDKATRCSTVRLQQTRTKAHAHFTPGYEAPELLDTGATTQTDMYSYGRMVAAVCSDGGPEAADFLARLSEADPAARLTAKEALEHSFFEATRFGIELLASCSLCFEDGRPVDKGLFCGSAHFLCGDCLSRYVREELDMVAGSAERLQRHQEREGRISCPHCPGTDSWSRYEDAALGQRLPAAVFDAYLAAKERVAENRIWREQQERLQAEVARLRTSFERDLAAQREASEAASSQAALAASNEAATAEFLRRQYPGAVQCPTCGLGPVIPEGCTDLSAHHGEARPRGARVSNACLGCGFFAADRAAWHVWDGQLQARG